MSETISLKQLEQKALRTCCGEDGLYDLFVGLMLGVTIVQGALADLGVSGRMLTLTGAALFLLVTSGFRLAKRFITTPRIGYVSFGVTTKGRRKNVVWLLVISALVVFFILPVAAQIFETDLGFLRGGYSVPVAFGLLAAAILVTMGRLLALSRMHVYAAFAAPSFVFEKVLAEQTTIPYPALLPFGVPAVIAVAIGVFYLVNFIRANPVASDVEVGHG